MSPRLPWVRPGGRGCWGRGGWGGVRAHARAVETRWRLRMCPAGLTAPAHLVRAQVPCTPAARSASSRAPRSHWQPACQATLNPRRGSCTRVVLMRLNSAAAVPRAEHSPYCSPGCARVRAATTPPHLDAQLPAPRLHGASPRGPAWYQPVAQQEATAAAVLHTALCTTSMVAQQEGDCSS
jgi:hypothetical protein